MIVQTGGGRFLVGGTGVVITFEPVDARRGRAGILKVDDGRFEDNDWQSIRRLNGDQTHQGRHLRIPVGDYEIQRLELYTYK